MNNQVVIVSLARTPIGRFLGKLSNTSTTELGALALQAAIERSTLTASQIQEVIMGNVVSAGVGQAPARQVALKAGCSNQVAALTINKVCGSGLKAVMLGTSAIRAGDAEIVAAGGMECMSQAPYYIQGARAGLKFGDQKMIDGLIFDGLWDPTHSTHMGNFADYTAQKAGLSREAQDQLALESHSKAIAARASLKEEIVPFKILDKQGALLEELDYDENPRENSSLQQLGSLRPAFSKDGSVTAGNASPLSDGAAALILMSAARAQQLGLAPLAIIEAYSTAGVAPKEIFFAPAQAIQQLLSKLGLSSTAAVDLVEINEAFAAQVLANEQELGLDRSKLNVHGGAIALGHPIGASGARVLVTLVQALRKRGGGRGIAALCLGGGNAVALAIKST